MKQLAMAMILMVSVLQGATIRVPQDQGTRSTGSETDTVWSLLLGGNQTESIESIFLMSAGGYLACGYTSSFGVGANDWYFAKITDLGDTVWTKTHGGNGYDYAFDLAETVDSGFVAAGYLDDAVLGNEVLFGIARFTSLGQVVWSRTYGVGVAKSICTTPDNGCIAVGIIAGLSVIRTDEIGDTVWTRSFSYLGFMEALSIRRVSSGGYIIVGGVNSADVLLMRIDELGDTLWSRTYGGPGIETGFSVIELSDGGFVVTGFTGTTVFAIRTDPNGNQEWMNYYDTGDGVEYTESAVPTGDNCFVIAASSSEFGTDDRNIKLLKIDQEGNTVWLRTYGSSAAEYTKAICRTNDGGYLVGADIPTPDTGGDILFLRISCSEMSFASNLNIGNTADHLVQHQPTISWIYEDPCGQPQQFSELEVGTDSDWQFSEMWNPAPFASADTFVVYNGAPLVDGATYWLRLRVNNGLAWSEWAELTFRMNSVPTTPEQRLPVDSSIVNTEHPTLVVRNPSDAENDSMLITFELSADSFATSIFPIEVKMSSDSLTSFWVNFPLNEDLRFWWRVKASDYYEESGYSPIWSFWINSVNSTPTAFSLLSPPNGSSPALPGNLPEFTWQNSLDFDPGDSVEFTLQLAIDPSFSFLSQITGLTSPNYSTATPLEWGRRYWWRVKAEDNSSGVRWSNETFDFKIMALGDADGSGTVTISDVVYLINYIFGGGAAPNPIESGDADCSGAVTISDVVYLINYIFAGTAAPCEP